MKFNPHKAIVLLFALFAIVITLVISGSIYLIRATNDNTQIILTQANKVQIQNEKQMSDMAQRFEEYYIVPKNGKDGADGVSIIGPDGEVGGTGASGESAYQIAVRHGFVGTEAEWIKSLVGKDGVTKIVETPATVQYVLTTDNQLLQKSIDDDDWKVVPKLCIKAESCGEV